jgi:hypothetical protein
MRVICQRVSKIEQKPIKSLLNYKRRLKLDLLNKALEKDLNSLASDIIGIELDTSGGKPAIKTIEAEPVAQCWYQYNTKKDRDADFKQIKEVISLDI